MNRLVLLASLFLCAMPVRAETMQEWVDAAPKADVGFTPWQAGSNTTNEGLRLAQGVYGTVDLSKLSPADFPVRVRILHTPAQEYQSNDVVFNGQGKYAMADPHAPALAPRYTEESTMTSPAEGNAVPIWPAPFVMRLATPTRYTSQMESVRLEVIGKSGALLARQLIGASAWNVMQRRAVVVNSPQMEDAIRLEGFEAIAVRSLFPDDFAMNNVDVVWIDSATEQDTALTDTYWRRILLGGTSIAGEEQTIAALDSRLGLGTGAAVLNGRLIACSTGPEMIAALKWETVPPQGSALATDTNPFYFSVVAGHSMNVELVSFSRWYLGLFFVLQAALIFVAFTQVRGEKRVWLWLGVPLFALLYALVGAVLAHVFVAPRAEAVIDQIERQHEGWPEAQVLTHFSHVSLDNAETVAHFPANSRPAFLIGTDADDSGADVVFHRDAAGTEVESSPVLARRDANDVRSWIPAEAPISATPDGKVTARRAFSAAWIWSGTAWLDLGPMQAGTPGMLETAQTIRPPLFNIGVERRWGSTMQMYFPGYLAPLLTPATTSALSAVGDSIFFGLEDAADCTLDGASSYLVHSRRVVAYQFHLPKQP